MPEDTTLAGNLVIQKTIVFEGFLTPPEITADLDNYAPTDFDRATVLRLSTDATRSLSGLAGGAEGREVRLYNVGSSNLVLLAEDAGSSAENRFAVPSFVTVAPGMAVILQYDGTSARWRALRAVTAGGGGAAVWGDISGDIEDQIDLTAALAAKASAAGLAAHVADTANPHAVTKAQVGLSAADNTADSAKPVSTAQAAADAAVLSTSEAYTDALAASVASALAGKASAAALAAHVADQANPHVVTKAQVGLGNADNTADTAKPVSTAQQTALDFKANIASPTFTGTPAAPTASPGDSTTKLATTAFVAAAVAANPRIVQIACSDLTTAITAGTNKAIFRVPQGMTLTAVRASVATAPTGSTIIIDINKNGTTILSTKLSIDASEKTSVTAATPPVISVASIADDDEIEIDFDQVGSTMPGAGVIVTLIGTA